MPRPLPHRHCIGSAVRYNEGWIGIRFGLTWVEQVEFVSLQAADSSPQAEKVIERSILQPQHHIVFNLRFSHARLPSMNSASNVFRVNALLQLILELSVIQKSDRSRRGRAEVVLCALV